MSVEPIDPPVFDAVGSSRAIDAMADLAEQSGHRANVLPVEFVSNAVRALRAARAWLDSHMTPFEAPSLDLFLNAPESEIPIEALIDTLRSTAVELIQVHKRLELRGFTRVSS
jgi:hypothetical protein